jgi:two-component system, OmpR family, sensor histidine kinase ChvG
LQAIEDTRLRWSGGLSLTKRILAVNIFAIALLAGSFFYIDGFRSKLIDERIAQAASEANLIAVALAEAAPDKRQRLVGIIGAQSTIRLRLFNADGVLIIDNWQMAGPTFTLRDPRDEPWQRKIARSLDDAIDLVVDANRLPAFAGFSVQSRDLNPGQTLMIAADRTHMIAANARVPDGSGWTVRTDRNARDIRRLVRAERSRLGSVIGLTILLSVLLSLFLARTIVRPLQILARAAISVRMGRGREVTVPRLPTRNDEIGRLARAISDMTQALRKRIDATEAFAADVAHEIKNPLASLGSAVQSLKMVSDPALQNQLMDIINEDVVRLDRLITDISDLSRVDAQLTRARFERVDLGLIIEDLIRSREARFPEMTVSIAFARPSKGSATILGDAARLSRVMENLIDNAISFSPAKSVVRVAAARSGAHVIVSVEDEGPGVSENARAAIFDRFHSDRPDAEAFGTHSGLGLSIAKTIVEGHSGTISINSRSNGKSGALFIIKLPAA